MNEKAFDAVGWTVGLSSEIGILEKVDLKDDTFTINGKTFEGFAWDRVEAIEPPPSDGQFYAQSESVKMLVSAAEHDLLLRAGALPAVRTKTEVA